MRKAMSVKEFDSLSTRDFDNGAILDEIREALNQREVLLEVNRGLLETFVQEEA